MGHYGTFKNGVVVFEQHPDLPDGTPVRVERLRRSASRSKASEAQEPILAKLARKFAGRVRGPRDWAENHDHYIHGTPKRKKR